MQDIYGVQYLTPEGLEQLKRELERLKSVERRRIAQQIQHAREKGDLSENAEYKAAKEEQALLEERIRYLEHLLATARVIEPASVDTSAVRLLCRVRVLNLTTNKEQEFVLVSETEANPREGRISFRSPIGRALLGKKRGEVVEVEVPAGKITLKILDISL